MNKPTQVSGWCPHYDKPSGCCYLSETKPASHTLENKCKNSSNCKTCGNFEAWIKGTNYKSK